MALIVSLISGLLMSGFFAFLVLYLMANQVASGLALTIFGIGISSMIGKNYIGTPIEGLSPYFFVIMSFVIVILVGYFFKKTKTVHRYKNKETQNFFTINIISNIKNSFFIYLVWWSDERLGWFLYIYLLRTNVARRNDSWSRLDSISFGCICNLEA